MKRIWKLFCHTVKGFYEDDCNARAAALTYFTLMSIVPVLAVILGLARGFGFAPFLEEVIKEQLSKQPDIANYTIDFAYSLLEETSSTLIAGVGVVLLLWTVYNILGNVEEALNDIWKIPCARSWIRKVTDYIAAIIICPLFFVVSSSLTIYLKTHIVEISRKVVFFEYLFIHFFPFLITWMLFTFLYFFLPNRKISFKHGMLGVLVGGTVYQLIQTFYINIQLKLSSYGAVYGSFAALPLFLIWLNLSWMIILAGAELAYQAEIMAWNYAPRREGTPQTLTCRRVLALMIIYSCIRNFCEGKTPYTIHQLSDKFGVAKIKLAEIIKILTHYKILSTTDYYSDGEIYYQPARDVNTITLKNVADIFPAVEKEIVSIYRNPSVSYFEGLLAKYDKKTTEIQENLPLSSINLQKL
ncbi:YihY/virulence factor BrkB family protein [Neochlamydia sp. S13]|uniref:YihY/virulence factor BrkB family protein n=1 Tax=Neochlamydia sp. S13 TaxID=1353976 RepID=UPI0005A948C9|nr:YihY/virulence factor BrkB family protein [Neochlamydia sp. S13]BBI17053.1 Putative RNase BN, tRNA processing enzyme [Neochlamydia sp. S13]